MTIWMRTAGGIVGRQFASPVPAGVNAAWIVIRSLRGNVGTH